MTDVVETVEAWACSFGLEHPLNLGNMVIRERAYTIVRVSMSSGAVGYAYSLSRNAPLDLVVTELLGPALLGQRLEDTDDLIALCRGQLAPVGTDGLVRRGISLLDIALWDIRASARGEPLWVTLSGHGQPAEVMIVEGYDLPRETPEAFVGRIADRVEQGFSWIKLGNGRNYPMDLRLRLTRERIGMGPELVVDIAWGWDDLEEACARLKTWEPYRLAWVEDPFPLKLAEYYKKLSLSTPIPIAAGDDATTPDDLTLLANNRAVHVVRVDATTIGGITAAARLCRSLDQLQLSPHVYPEIHQHLAFAWHNVRPIELYPRDRSFDLSHRFIRDSLLWERPGYLSPPTEPGIGIQIDFESLRHHTVRHSQAVR